MSAAPIVHRAVVLPWQEKTAYVIVIPVTPKAVEQGATGESLHCLFNRYRHTQKRKKNRTRSRIQMLEGPPPLTSHSLVCIMLAVLSRREDEARADDEL